jgi:hypothetical protein
VSHCIDMKSPFASDYIGSSLDGLGALFISAKLDAKQQVNASALRSRKSDT